MILQYECTASDLYVARCSAPRPTHCCRSVSLDDLNIWETVRNGSEETLPAVDISEQCYPVYSTVVFCFVQTQEITELMLGPWASGLNNTLLPTMNGISLEKTSPWKHRNQNMLFCKTTTAVIIIIKNNNSKLLFQSIKYCLFINLKIAQVIHSQSCQRMLLLVFRNICVTVFWVHHIFETQFYVTLVKDILLRHVQLLISYLKHTFVTERLLELVAEASLAVEQCPGRKYTFLVW